MINDSSRNGVLEGRSLQLAERQDIGEADGAKLLRTDSHAAHNHQYTVTSGEREVQTIENRPAVLTSGLAKMMHHATLCAIDKIVSLSGGRKSGPRLQPHNGQRLGNLGVRWPVRHHAFKIR